ncbi:MAG: hypothetical protein JRD87_06230 [Deltaproteobacteria bacterium]|jgi:hypothetical protein|nr:hypothetical protein [Deltaproteobacteria bacterium]MBW2238057.1 hypothetical protein [Deltaproteobacteria bacterium]MBW2571042.1 hypothetical protein [Deltaproteobacteria bacterium]MBW2669472.1 hypothetical protein [Deltaproteobacteria bacterium]MBW2710735.1 hypothetical protein [Deltaproteobacteria bacterium]
MQHIRKNKTRFSVITVFVILIFASTGFSAGSSAGRILPKGTVSLFHDHQKIGEFSSEAPLPEDTLMSVQGECGVKLSDLYLVAADKSLFSVTTDSDFRRLTVKTGIVYFALSALPRALVFQTPDGVITIHEVILKAASNSKSLKGYVFVEEGITRVGVLEGGAMLMMVDDGKPITIDAGRELRLAQAEIFKEEKEEGKAEEGTAEGTAEGEAAGETGTAVSTGGVSTAAVVGGIVLLGGVIALAAGGGGGDDGGASPASP